MLVVTGIVFLQLGPYSYPAQEAPDPAARAESPRLIAATRTPE
jgi:hypothetical protein